MSNIVHAIFEDGVFRPTSKVDLPEHVAVEFEPKIVDQLKGWPVDYFSQTSGALAGEVFERPEQGDFSDKDTW